VLPGVKIKEIKKIPDERGSFAEIDMNDPNKIKKINIQDSIIANGSSIDENSLENTFQFMLGERSRVNL